ncbi:hypothetical protein T11_13938 [Trichinella zimbabwensis]|uniref:Uncharacterized protein n=1 Tax=Trichinella zimbabwensis TaxID=268475 RepID=A0A0V1H0U2_9BILA|nr:hypothetical protein T11_13938 [Trichinella zimbabwensis]
MLLCSIIYNKQQNLPTGANSFQDYSKVSSDLLLFHKIRTSHATAYGSNEMENNIFSIESIDNFTLIILMLIIHVG